MNFSKPINGLRKKIGRRMIVGIKLLVSRGALQPEIGAQIDNPATMPKQRNGELSRDAVRQGQENDFRIASEQVRVWFGKTKALRVRMGRESGENLGDGLTG